MENWRKEVKWQDFATRIILKNGNPSLQDAKECNLPVGIFNEICMANISRETMLAWANQIISHYGKKGKEM